MGSCDGEGGAGTAVHLVLDGSHQTYKTSKYKLSIKSWKM
jgi:hypothetical protein